MPIVTITSDWNQNDYYLGALKGKLLSLFPDLNLVDISHSITSYNISKAAFVINHSYQHFPEGSIHLIAVNTESGKKPRFLALKMNGHYFIANDNGVFGLILNEHEGSVFELESEEQLQGGFQALEGFPRLVKAIIDKDKKLIQTDSFKKKVTMHPVIDESIISGSVVYVNSYKNVVTNISEDLFDQIGKNRRFLILVQSNFYKIKQINSSYEETAVGELMAIFNSLGLLEIAIKDGNAADLLNLSTHSVIKIKFFEA